jgi:hypothetical protein
MNKIVVVIATASFLALSLGCTTQPESSESAELAVGQCGTLGPGQRIVTGKPLDSCDGRLSLVMQTDGNLVLYTRTTSGTLTPLWHSRTANTGGSFAGMGGDGNLAVYTADNRPIYSTDTVGHPGAYLALQDDGNMVISDPSRNLQAIWYTGTRGFTPSPHGVWTRLVTLPGNLPITQRLTILPNGVYDSDFAEQGLVEANWGADRGLLFLGAGYLGTPLDEPLTFVDLDTISYAPFPGAVAEGPYFQRTLGF